MLIDENSSISILIIRLFHLIGVLINYFTLTNGKTQFLLAKLIDGVSFPVYLNFDFFRSSPFRFVGSRVAISWFDLFFRSVFCLFTSLS